MSWLHKEVFEEINKLRSNPQSYLPHLQEMQYQFKGKLLYRPGEDPVETEEGIVPVYECINFLQFYKPVTAIEWDDNIAKACIDHANDIGQRGIIKKKFLIKYMRT